MSIKEMLKKIDSKKIEKAKENKKETQEGNVKQGPMNMIAFD